MATSILTSVGAAVGVPGGSAIGAFLGRQVDRQISGPPSASRISDLRIPSAHYGAEVPLLVGVMRVAGTILWASDVVEGVRASKTGMQHARSVCFALALSSSELRSVKRIWADGRLIRGAAGDHKIPFKFRLISGSEDQDVDPLIASFEGMNNSPSFRGLALIVFEDFDLGTFGNRIPQINVEAEAIKGSVNVSELMASELSIVSRSDHQAEDAGGYAIQGRTALEGLQPIASLFQPDFTFENEWKVGTKPVTHQLGPEEYCHPDDAFESSTGTSILPTQVTVRYFDQALDFGVGEQSVRSSSADHARVLEFPGTLTSNQAKSLAQARLNSAWTQARDLKLSLPLVRAAQLRLGDLVLLSADSRPLRIVKKVIRSDHAEITLVRKATSDWPLEGDSGRNLREDDYPATELRIRVFELPSELSEGRPSVAVAVAGGTTPYRTSIIDLTLGGATFQLASARRPAIMGYLVEPLKSGAVGILDLENRVEVQLFGDEWLFNVEDGDLLAGANIIVVGGEVLQFGSAEALGQGRYRLSRLIRGRFASKVASEAAAGTSLILIEPSSIVRWPVTAEMIGSPVDARVIDGNGEPRVDGVDYRGTSFLPLSPVHLHAGWQRASLSLNWIRRSRQGAPWLDHVDSPLGESREEYLVELMGADETKIVLRVESAQVIVSEEQLSVLGAMPWTIAVRQIGDFGLSDQCKITFAEEQ